MSEPRYEGTNHFRKWLTVLQAKETAPTKKMSDDDYKRLRQQMESLDAITEPAPIREMSETDHKQLRKQMELLDAIYEYTKKFKKIYGREPSAEEIEKVSHLLVPHEHYTNVTAEIAELARLKSDI